MRDYLLAVCLVISTSLTIEAFADELVKSNDVPIDQRPVNVVSVEEIAEYSPVRSGKLRYDWKWLSTRFDADADGRVSQAELAVSMDDFDHLDANWDGVLTASDFDWTAEGALCRQKETTFALFKSADVNSDGRLSAEELQSLIVQQEGEKGYLNEHDLERLIFRPRVLKAKAEYQSRASHISFQMDDQGQIPMVPDVDSMAPDFELKSPDGFHTFRLSNFRGKRPVVLIFGCLSCGNYRTYSEALENLFRRHQGNVEFMRVYVREAHPSDTRTPTTTNARAGILVKQPVSLAERCQIAERCAADLQIETPMVVDGIDNKVGEAYGGWPDRLYLIDVDGRVAYQGGPGPFAFNPRELEQSLILLLLDQRNSQSRHR